MEKDAILLAATCASDAAGHHAKRLRFKYTGYNIRAWTRGTPWLIDTVAWSMTEAVS